MSRSSPADTGATSTAIRASGRVRRQPEVYSSSPAHSSAKRKRNANDDDGDRQMPDDYVSDEDVPTDEDEPAEEEIRERAQKARRPKKATASKPAAKRPKTTGATLPIRAATGGNKKKRPAKKTKAADAADAEGLYADVFGSDMDLEDVAAGWLRSFDAHESQALADIVNFVLTCAGCNSGVHPGDIEDPDCATDRLTDIQGEYQATEPTDFPLHRKGRAGTNFKDTMSTFIIILMRSIAAKGLLYADNQLMQNIENWFSPMTSAASRAFRHTATVASLAVITALCEIASDSANEAAAAQRQADTERRKPKVNQARVDQLDRKAREIREAQDWYQGEVRDWFDTVFIHRYRDVDPVIRKDCATALGEWIVTLPHVFFDGNYLKYLGWVLSDSASITRAEVIKQLYRLYREEDKIAGMRTFTERFRPRLIEIATSDADSTVRTAGIELLNLLRENGLLEPDDIDAVGRLVYDADARVRKAVAKFFGEIVNDLYNLKTDEMGGLKNLEESLPEVDDENFESPKLEWLKFKSLAEMLVNYDAEDDLPSQVERTRGDGGLILHAAATESRFTLAADAILDKIAECKDWKTLAGYLLFDHSSAGTNGVANDALSQLKQDALLTEKEAFVLLEVVSTSVRQTLQELQDKSTSTKMKLTKKQKELVSENQEEAARHLATLIPKLLKKYGDVPNTAAAVLRMESVLDMPSLRSLHEDTTAYSTILDDVRKQFMSHGTDDVLGPASKAIQHAKSYTELEEVAEEKIGGLWEDVISNLVELVHPATLPLRGQTSTDGLRGLSNNLLRIIRLSQASNPIAALEDGSVAMSHDLEEYNAAIDFLIALTECAIAVDAPALDPQEATLEDEVAARAAEAALRYFQWKLSSMIQTLNGGVDFIPYEEMEILAVRRDTYVQKLEGILTSRQAGEQICVTMANYCLELYTAATVLRTVKIREGMDTDWDVMIMDLHDELFRAVMKVFNAAEKNFARLSGRKLENSKGEEDEEDINADPVDDDPLSDEEDDEDEEETQASQLRRENKQRSIVLAERTLCELARSLIFAIHAGVLPDADAVRRRLERNKLKLGSNYKEICAYLDLDGRKGAARGKGVKAKKGKVVVKGKKSTKSSAIVAEDEVEDEIEDDEEEEEEALTRRELVEVVDVDVEGVEDEGQEQVVGAEVESVIGD